MYFNGKRSVDFHLKKHFFHLMQEMIIVIKNDLFLKKKIAITFSAFMLNNKNEYVISHLKFKK